METKDDNNYLKALSKVFMRMALDTANNSTCLNPNRHIGCILCRDDIILTTGYNHSATPQTCRDRGVCLRQDLNIASGTDLQKCYAIHAEQMAITNCARDGISTQGATLYSTHFPCSICAKLIIGAGITKIYYINDYPDEFAKTLLYDANIITEKLTLE